MLPTLLFQVFTVTADILIFVFVAYYLLKLGKKEKTLEEKETKVDTEYHQVVDNALTRERKILEDATKEAEEIITSAKYVSEKSKEAVAQSLQGITVEVQKEATATSKAFIDSFSTSLNSISAQSLGNFQKVTEGLGEDLQKQVKSFHDTMLPKLEQELEEYKQMRIKKTDELITQVVQKVAQETLNKSITPQDHEALLAEALEKAKKEGFFD